VAADADQPLPSMRIPVPDFTLDFTFICGLLSVEVHIGRYPFGSMSQPLPALTFVLVFMNFPFVMSAVWIHAWSAAIRVHGSSTAGFDFCSQSHVGSLLSYFL
jgi:hypothetical protein